MGVEFSEKKRYVTLEWPGPCTNTRPANRLPVYLRAEEDVCMYLNKLQNVPHNRTDSILNN